MFSLVIHTYTSIEFTTFKPVTPLLCPTAEHSLSKASGIMIAVASTDDIIDAFRYYFTKTSAYDQFFAVTDYSLTTAIVTLISNFIATFTWNFTDLFIILVSLALTERFRLFNEYLGTVRGKVIC